MHNDTTSTQTHLTWREMENKPAPSTQAAASKRIPAGVCAIFLGALGVHKFILGYTKQGLIMLLFTLLTIGFGGVLMFLIGVIEGIVYLTKSDEEFVQTYQTQRRGWF
jgi:TM2 domain-containing membrane protein YozV